MAKYLDLLSNFTPAQYNLSFNPQNDSITPAIEVARKDTGGWFGFVYLVFAWVVLFVHIAKQENNFGLSVVQSMISTNTMVFSLAVIFVYVGILANIKFFIWFLLAVFIVHSWGVFRSG